MLTPPALEGVSDDVLLQEIVSLYWNTLACETTLKLDTKLGRNDGTSVYFEDRIAQNKARTEAIVAEFIRRRSRVQPV